ncbi:MAG: hypothetical protein ABSF79_00705 [Smithellaceae bacterium]|jgi:hypothetical protein
MSRAADYTIKGFLYQFNKTLLEILNSQDDLTPKKWTSLQAALT